MMQAHGRARASTPQDSVVASCTLRVWAGAKMLCAGCALSWAALARSQRVAPRSGFVRRKRGLEPMDAFGRDSETGPAQADVAQKHHGTIE